MKKKKTRLFNLSVPQWFLRSFLFLVHHFFILFYSFFLVQKSFQGEDAMWLHRKATQKKQFAAAVISLILLS